MNSPSPSLSQGGRLAVAATQESEGMDQVDSSWSVYGLVRSPYSLDSLVGLSSSARDLYGGGQDQQRHSSREPSSPSTTSSSSSLYREEITQRQEALVPLDNGGDIQRGLMTRNDPHNLAPNSGHSHHQRPPPLSPSPRRRRRLLLNKFLETVRTQSEEDDEQSHVPRTRSQRFLRRLLDAASLSSSSSSSASPAASTNATPKSNTAKSERREEEEQQQQQQRNSLYAQLQQQGGVEEFNNEFQQRTRRSGSERSMGSDNGSNRDNMETPYDPHHQCQQEQIIGTSGLIRPSLYDTLTVQCGGLSTIIEVGEGPTLSSVEETDEILHPERSSLGLPGTSVSSTTRDVVEHSIDPESMSLDESVTKKKATNSSTGRHPKRRRQRQLWWFGLKRPRHPSDQSVEHYDLDRSDALSSTAFHDLTTEGDALEVSGSVRQRPLPPSTRYIVAYSMCGWLKDLYFDKSPRGCICKISIGIVAVAMIGLGIYLVTKGCMVTASFLVANNEEDP